MQNTPTDPWAAFPDAQPALKPRKSRRSEFPDPIAPDTVLRAPMATDGDTVRSEQGNVRLVGVDAPELKQRGFNRNGEPVAIGRQSQQFLDSYLSNGPARTGALFGRSFGRTVSPITVDGNDAGHAVLRYGHGFAAPEYLVEVPGKRFQYSQAERLARANSLGVHGLLTQSPTAHRKNPDWQPTDEELKTAPYGPPIHGVAKQSQNALVRAFFDKNTSEEEIQKLASSFGLGVDLGQLQRLRNSYFETGKLPSQEVFLNAIASTEAADGPVGAATRTAADALSGTFLAELGAIPDTFGGTNGRENLFNSERSFGEIWQNNRDQNEAILRNDAGNVYPQWGALNAPRVLAQDLKPAGLVTETIYEPPNPELKREIDTYTQQWLRNPNRELDEFVNFTTETLRRYGQEPASPDVIRASVIKHYIEPLERGETVHSQGLSGTTRPATVWDRAHSEIASGKLGTGLIGAGNAWSFGQLDEIAGGVNSVVKGTDYEAERDRIDFAKQDAFRRNPGSAFTGEVLGGVSLAGAAARYAPALARKAIERPILSSAIAGGTYGFGENNANRVEGVVEGTVGGAVGGAIGKHLIEPVAKHAWNSNAMQTVRDYATRIGNSKPTQNQGIDDAFAEFPDAEPVTQAMAIPQMAAIQKPARQFDGQPLLEPASRAQLMASASRVQPQDMLPVPRNFVEGPAEAAQINAGRFGVEQQSDLADGPIWQDASRLADDAAPFPPVQAYEEWPSDAIERVGNIDLGGLDTPQDISRALRSTHNAVGGFDAATRGRVSQAETERLAAELNMTPQSLLSRRKGQAFNAEEALAARQLLAKSGNELVNAAKRVTRLDDPGDEMLAEFRQKWMRHVAIQEQVAGMTAEAGRALAQFKRSANSRAVRGDVLSALVRAGGGKDGLQDAANTLLEAVEMGPGKFNALAEKAAKPKWRDKISELYINMLLSNPPTHIVNMVGNSLTAVTQLPEHAAASLIGAGRQAINGRGAKERILMSEVGARAFGLVQGAKEGAQLFARALRTGEADDFVSKVEGDEYKSISGLKGEAIRLPTRFLTAEDQFFKGIARRMELNAQAVRQAHKEGLRDEARRQRIVELMANPTDEMLERAMDYGRYLTFQRKLGETGQSISRISANSLPAKVVIPFVRTPINLLKFATERSPLAPMLKEWRADFSAGGDRRDLAIAKSLIGTGLATVMYQAAQEGKITGAVPPDSSKARLMYADGWQPYSVKVGDQWVSYSRLDPLSTTIGVAADMATLPDGMSERQQDDQATMLVASIMGNLASKTWLSGVSSLVEGLSDPGRYAGNWVQRVAGAFTVPAGVAGVARAMDPIARKRENVGEAIQARIPGMSDELLPRRDIFGEPIEMGAWGPDFLSPFWSSKDENDPVVAEMLRIGKGVSASGKQFTEDGVRVDYTPEEYDRYHEIAGRLTYNRLLGLIGSEGYVRQGDDDKRKAAKKAIREARETARSVLSDPRYPLPRRGEVGQLGLEQPMNNKWADFPDAVGAN